MANVFRSHLLASCVAGLLASAAAHADVTMQEQMSLSGSGMMKMANMSGTTTTVISGDRARTESDMTFESAMMRTFARGGGNHVEIVRLDQDKIYSLNTKKKTYTETTFAEQRAKMQEAMEAMNKGQASQQQATSGVDESECEWSEPKSEAEAHRREGVDRRVPGGARHGHCHAVLRKQEGRPGVRLRPGVRPMARAGLRGLQPRRRNISARMRKNSASAPLRRAISPSVPSRCSVATRDSGPSSATGWPSST